MLFRVLLLNFLNILIQGKRCWLCNDFKSSIDCSTTGFCTWNGATCEENPQQEYQNDVFLMSMFRLCESSLSLATCYGLDEVNFKTSCYWTGKNCISIDASYPCPTYSTSICSSVPGCHVENGTCMKDTCSTFKTNLTCIAAVNDQLNADPCYWNYTSNTCEDGTVDQMTLYQCITPVDSLSLYFTWNGKSCQRCEGTIESIHLQQLFEEYTYTAVSTIKAMILKLSFILLFYYNL